MRSLAVLLKMLRDAPASDLQLWPDASPSLRMLELNQSFHGDSMSVDEIRDLVDSALERAQRARLATSGEVTVRLDTAESGRFRMQIVESVGGFVVSVRSIPNQVPTLDELGFPESVVVSCGPTGLVLVAGPRGSGRSTTVAALLTKLAELREARVVTVEDPIEHALSPSAGVAVQREVFSHAPSVEDALKDIGRFGANILYLPAVDDAESLERAISLAESEHLVFATLDATTLKASIERLVGRLSDFHRRSLLSRLASTLRVFVNQRLVPNLDRTQLVLAVERFDLNVASAFRHLKSGDLDELFRELRLSAGSHKNVHLNGALARLYSGKKIDLETAYRTSVDVAELQDMIDRLENPKPYTPPPRR